MPAVDGDIQPAGYGHSPQMAGARDFQHGVVPRSDVRDFGKEMCAGNLFVFVEQVLPDFADVILLEAMIVVLWGSRRP